MGKKDKKSKSTSKIASKTPAKGKATSAAKPAKPVKVSVKPVAVAKGKSKPKVVAKEKKLFTKPIKTKEIENKTKAKKISAKPTVTVSLTKKVAEKEKEKEKKGAAPLTKKSAEVKPALKGKGPTKVVIPPAKILAKDSKKKMEDDVEDTDDLDGEALKPTAKKEKSSFHFSEKMKKDVEQIEEKIKEQFINLREYFQWKDIEDAILSMEIFLPKGDECLERACENIRTSGPYCRYHYIYHWKHINRKKEILKEGKLQNYIEELISKYPPQYIQMLIDDLSDERDFFKVLTELNISDAELEIEEIEDIVDEEADDMDFEPRSIDSFKAGFDDE